MIIIIGSGLAGYSVAKEFRKLDTDTPITIITADDGTNYSKPLLSNALTKQKTPDMLAMQDATKMSETLNADIKTHARVTHIDAASRTIYLGEESLTYEKLVLATGAAPIKPTLQGNAIDNVFYVNSLIHYREFHSAIESAQSIAIIGPGLIGCEFANDIANSGKTVTVIGPDKTPLSLLLPKEAGNALKTDLEALGIHFKLGCLPTSVNIQGSQYSVELDNGETITADVVLCAIGLKPCTEIAQTADIEYNRGIVTNRLLETSQKNIFALGDCVEIEGRYLPYIMPIMHSARALAKTLAGTPTPINYPAMPVVIKTPAHPIVIASPNPDAQGDWHIEHTEHGVKALFKQKDTLLGFALTGDAVKEKQVLSKLLPPVLQ